MPPRKKATADDAVPAPTRSSSRIKAATNSQPAGTAGTSTTQPDVPAETDSKPKAKRTRSATTDDAAPKPASKRTKKSQTTDDKVDSDINTQTGTQDSDNAKGKRSATTTQDDGAAPKPASAKTKSQTVDDKAKDAVDTQGATPDSGEKDDAQPAVDDKKMVTVLKRGAAPVDAMSGCVNTHQVYSNTEGVWDAMLNQTDVSGNQNKNKFYVIQLLHPIGNNNTCTLFTRWGRVGENGQTQTKGPFSSSTAVNEFKKQFRSKTAVAWEQRVGMVPKPGKYTWLERDYGDEESKDDDQKAAKDEVIIPDSKLPSEIQELCNLLFSTSIIDAHLSSMNYDARKLPLGKLAKSTILSGFSALKTLADVIQNPTGPTATQYGGMRRACEQLSSAYYSVIPHDFGRNRPVVIDNEIALKKELDLVDALGDMEIASKLISSTSTLDADGNPINPIDSHFRSLGLTSMEPVPKDSAEFNSLVQYARDTHGATHRYTVNVRHAYRVERDSETQAWNSKNFSSVASGERLLLWHGSRTTNFAGILKQGLRIAPPEAPVTGYMFGKGVYFADMMSKSANYCYAYLSNNTGLLLLCEVLVKPFHELTNASYHADQECKKAGKMATKGLGRTQPGAWKDAGAALNHPELSGCEMPSGPGKDVTGIPGICLQYNEYIVYDPSQIRLRYLLMVDM
ncbi:Poly [ADP-ribose] polymerase 2 [Psilocybe cubensis]|uniref:Poly [ADP-ribose] polymerase n=2 Tax=Psilocybe cubensis TaxID=181762 RepID=A0A8H7Y4G5_PSICU|nr:Poly [ADP-ribose] polymerase 2 [Psilocybe cubensis]KAH9486025.1 Poly [ADP-ribose] polymerase 2 [Psilocybe cubensis]